MRFWTLCVRFKTDILKNGIKHCSPHRNFMKTMCTCMDRCQCAVVIWLWHKFFRLWGKLCAMRWGKITGCGVTQCNLPPVLVCQLVLSIHLSLCEAYSGGPHNVVKSPHPKEMWKQPARQEPKTRKTKSVCTWQRRAKLVHDRISTCDTVGALAFYTMSGEWGMDSAQRISTQNEPNWI